MAEQRLGRALAGVCPGCGGTPAPTGSGAYPYCEPCEDRLGEPEAAGAADVDLADDMADLRRIRAFLAKAGELRRNATAHDVSRVLDDLAASNARAERLAASWAEVEEIGRSLDLVGFDLNDGLVCQHAERLTEIARAALAGDAPGRGEAG